MTGTATLRVVLATLAAFAMPENTVAQSDPAPLRLETKIPLGDVTGRIDHMAVDLARRRLFVAELGNNSVGVVDLDKGAVLRRISGLREPQGVAYLPATDSLYVANAGDGVVRVFRGADYADAGQIALGADADNIRFDSTAQRLVVGYGNGALALIEPAAREKSASYALPAHPESFQIDAKTDRIFVNVPSAHAIVVLDRVAGKQLASWPMRHGGNFPMMLDAEQQRVFSVFRSPAKLAAFATGSGRPLFEADVCGDSDDLFLDSKRRRVYVSCGEGAVDVFEEKGGGLQRIARVPSVGGARTSLFVPDIDRLFVAVRARGEERAAIWVYRPAP